MRRFLWSFLEVIETTAIALAAVFVVRTFIVQPFLVSGASMEPNFHDGDYLLVDELTYRFRTPERGEVVVFRHPQNPRSYYIKRIIGLPGERVKISNGEITIYFSDGKAKKLVESYISQQKQSGDFDFRLGPNEYFVMGDNRNFSFDSRSWGPLDRDHLIGVVRARLWPINRVMAFSAPAY
jgi:signal peptidase I